MNRTYPNHHHPIFFLQDALGVGGIATTFHRDDQSRGLWGLEIQGRMVVWLIDMRWAHEREAHGDAVHRLIADGALVMAAQKPDAEFYNCEWLPLAATPGYMPCAGNQKITDLAFVGYVRDNPRNEALLHLNSRFSIAISEGLFGDDAVSAYHHARLGVNIPTRYADPQAYDINMRVFEIMATGTPLITNWLPELEALGIVHNKTAFLYKNEQNMLDVISEALNRDDLGIVGQRAARLITQNHTYAHRAKQVMEWIAQ